MEVIALDAEMHSVRFNDFYKSGKIIGEGGFGTVFEGTRVKDGLKVAIKRVHKNRVFLWSSLANKKVPLEKKLLQQLQQVQGVIKLIEYFEEEDCFLTVMERIECSKDFFDFLYEEGELDEATARHFFKQLIEIVINCRNQGVCHSDLKLENLIVDPNRSELKLIDFGSATVWRETELYFFNGTRVYSPPEWVKSGVYYPESGTVWSLGVVLFEFLFGYVPFERDSEICKANIPFNTRKDDGMTVCCMKGKSKTLTQECLDIIEKCLEKRKEERIKLDDILQHPWILAVEV